MAERLWVTSPSYQAAVEALISVRREAGVSQRDLANQLGKPRSFISKIESRERRLDVIEFIALARALGQEPGELIRRMELAAGERLVF